MKTSIFPIVILTLVLLISACEDNDPVDSTVVPTSNVYADINVSSEDGVNVFVTVQLKEGAVDSDRYIDLASSDQLYSSMDERIDTVRLDNNLFSNLDYYSTRQKLLSRHDSGLSIDFLWMEFVKVSRVWYFSGFDNGGDGSKFYVSYMRNDYHVSALDTSVTLPGAFNIIFPGNNGDVIYSRTTDDINVSWSQAGSGAMVDLSVTANCDDGATAAYHANVADTGAYTVAANTISSLTGPCTYTIKVEKFTIGSLDSGFGGGVIRGRQIRSVNVNTSD